MFHVKHSRLVAIFAGLVLIGLLTGCGQVSKPSGWSAPVDAGDGVVVVHEKRGTLTALRVTDSGSAVLWRFPGDGDDRNYQGFYATPIVDRSGATPRLLAASYSGHVVSIDLSNGGLTAGWPEEVKVGGHVVATPALDGDALYVATSGGDVKPVSISTGVVGAAVVRAGDRIWGAPAVEGGVVYAGSLDGKLYAANADGGERWRRDVGGAIAGDVVVVGDTVYAGTLESRLVAVDKATGEVRWEFSGDNWFWARPLISDDTVYAPTTLGEVYAIDRASGRERWRSKAGSGEMHAAPTLTGGVLVVADRDGGVYGLDPASGAQQWQQRQSGQRFYANPLVQQSTVLYLSTGGMLVRVRPQDEGALSVIYERG